MVKKNKKKNIINKLHMFLTSFANELILSKIHLIKDRKNISVYAGSFPPYCFGIGHVTALFNKEASKTFNRQLWL